MGNCFAKPDAFVNNCPAIFPDAKGFYNSEEGSGCNFEPLQTYDSHISSSLDFNRSTCSSHKDLSAPLPCSVVYSQIGHDSAANKTQIPEKVSVGGSVEKSFVNGENSPMELIKKTAVNLVHLLQKSFDLDDNPPMELVTARLNPILLPPRGESSGKGTSMGLIHECKEDPVHSKIKNPRSEFVGLNLVKCLRFVRRNSVRGRSINKVDGFSSAIIPDTVAGDEISGARIPMESSNLFSILNNINGEENNCSGRVEEADATAAKFKDCQSRSSGLRRPYSLVAEDEKAFGSPFWGKSNNLCEKRRDCSSVDEFSDSSSDLFDIDFQKPDRIALTKFALNKFQEK